MSFRFKSLVWTAFAAVVLAVPAFSQIAFTQGTVKDVDGTPVQGAKVIFDRLDMATHLEAKTDKKGHYIMGMKPATYSVQVTVDGKVRQKMSQFEAGAAPDDLNFTLKPVAAAGAAGKPGAPETLTAAPPTKGDPAADKEKDKAAKDREAQLAKNKELNDSSVRKNGLENKQWDEAITQLTKASELGPTQHAVWAALCRGICGQRQGRKRSRRRTDLTTKGSPHTTSCWRSLRTMPGLTTTTRLRWRRTMRLDDAKVKLAKAVELDPRRRQVSL